MKMLQWFLITFLSMQFHILIFYHDESVNIDHIEDPIKRSIKQYESHQSIVAIKTKNTNTYFKFNSILKSEIEKEILNLDSSEACYSEFNRPLETSVFPSAMELANVYTCL